VQHRQLWACLLQVEFIEDMFAHLSRLYASTLHKPELRDRYPKPSFKARSELFESTHGHARASTCTFWQWHVRTGCSGRD
jgi:hypothetical protein